jgi:TrmH family RNA methyltransferase
LILRSRDNPQFKHWVKLAADARYRRKERRALIEGPHLVAALLERDLRPLRILIREDSQENPEVRTLVKNAGLKPIELAKGLFNSIADTETPQGIAAEIEIPEGRPAKGDCVFMEGVQDAGNVGAIIRSAAAFGIGAVALDQDCADVWSPKVLRAGAGAHFSVQINQTSDLAATLDGFRGKLVATVPRGGTGLAEADLSGILGWLLGSEGKGLSAALQAKAALKICIPTAAGTESLNVAAAAAVCFYQASRLGVSRPGAGS